MKHPVMIPDHYLMFHVKHSHTILLQHSKYPFFDRAAHFRDIRGQYAVMFEHWHKRARDFIGLLHAHSRFQWFAKLEHLRGTKQFDCDNLLGLLYDTQQLVSAGYAHTDKVFHAGRCWDGIDTGGMRQYFYLVNKGRRDVLRDHKTRVQPRVGCQKEWRAALVPVIGPHQTVDTSLRETRQLGQHDRQHVERQRQWLPVKIPTA